MASPVREVWPTPAVAGAHTVGFAGRAPGAVASLRASARVDRYDLFLLAALAAVSLWVAVVDLRLAAAHGLVWTGVDGEYPVDQMQYLAWVQDASRHLLVSDLFVLRPTPHDYLQPMVAVSGGLTAAGVAPWLALLVWKPAAVAAIFFAVRALARRLLPTRGQQCAAMALALFAGSWGTLGDEWIPFISWGYVFGLVAVAAGVGALVSYERAYRQQRFALLPSAFALLASWLHPWQGEQLIFVLVGSELLAHRTTPARSSKRPLLLPASTIAAIALPLLYYVLLGRADPAWRFAASATPHQQWPLQDVLLPLAPMLVAAIPAYLRPPTTFLGLATRLWPVGALAVWGLARGGLEAGALHAWTGITIPLAVLAVQGVQALGFKRLPGYRWIGAIAVLALTIPATISMMEPTSGFVTPAKHSQNLITPREQQAFKYLANDPQPGGVLSTYALGDAVPGETGRRTYAADDRWSGAGYRLHETMAWEVLHGWITGPRARAFVLSTGARFVLADCAARANLAQTLAPAVATVHRFGCVRVYEIR
jgi:hypothetical protein